MIEKALRDEDAYNAFRQSYNSMFDDGYEDAGMRFLDDGTIVDLSTGDRYRYDEETGEEELLDEVPTKIGAGIEHDVYSVPDHNFVTKIPKSRDSYPDRMKRSGENTYNGPEGVTRSPLEAFWSQVLGQNQPVTPYSLFQSKHNQKPSLDLVQRDLRSMGNNLDPMTQQLAVLLNMKDLGIDEEDILGELEQFRQDEGRLPTSDDWGGVQGEDLGDMSGGVFGMLPAGNVTEDGSIYDYASEKPFIGDEHGGIVPQAKIDEILRDAIHQQGKVPKRYQKYDPSLNQDIRQLISELGESSKKGRFIDSSISFPDTRWNVEGF